EWDELRRHIESVRDQLATTFGDAGVEVLLLEDGGHIRAVLRVAVDPAVALDAVPRLRAGVGIDLRPRTAPSRYAPQRRVRPVAMCVLLQDRRLLVGEGGDAAEGRAFLRPPAGEVEFGEFAAEAVQREMAEEVDVRGAECALIGVLENVFHGDGAPGHEIVFVFAAYIRDDEAALTGVTEVHSGHAGHFGPASTNCAPILDRSTQADS
ncbi:MAG: NUDIX domain-containing protein, partial [Actinomycetota bacterium]|nr:NUDIX domain-containing protein [Actinomycetota bacterium]